MTVAELCDLYFREGALLPTRRGTLKKPSTLAGDRRSIENHLLPLLGSRRMSSVTRADVARFMADVAAGKTATADRERSRRRGARATRGGVGVASRVAAVLSAVFTFAVRRDLLKDNPVHGVPKYASRARERYLRMDELERFGAALREGETVGIAWEPDPAKKTKHAPKPENRRVVIDQYAAAALRLLLFTGARRGEILSLRWDYVDVERGLIFLPDSKTGRKTIILNGPALAVLADLPKDGPFVIAGRDASAPRVDLKKPWDAICRRAGLDGVRLHDLRHTHASFGVCAGFGLPVVGKLLGHATPQTTARYAHLDIDPVRIASQRIGDVLARALAPAPVPPEPPPSPAPAGNVVPFRRAAS